MSLKEEWEKPVFEKEEVSAHSDRRIDYQKTFPKSIIKEFNKNMSCLQCSGCHGCR